ncbi:MAG: outer membrane beta-barrel family protein [Muribaculaceae bacterium]|nr:outer membrane beta-barrel family protein [Muribaculaceae bacterium]
MKYIFFLSLFLSLHLTLEARSSLQPDSTVKNDTVSLKEVVVKAPALNTIMEVDGNVTIIKDTELSKLTNPYEVMKFIPGLIVTDESVEVANVGAPEIYIDKVKVRDRSELTQLSPERIKSIKVIDSPGAKYGGDVRAVILITTYRRPGDGLAVKDRLTLSYRDFFNPSDLLSLNFRSGNLDIFATIDYSHSNSKSATHTSTEYFYPSSSFRSENDIQNRSHSNSWKGKIGFNYSPTPDHLFGAYYQGTYQKSHTNLVSGLFSNFVDNVLVSSANVNKTISSSAPRHRVNTFYAANWGRWKGDINFDFLLSRSHTCLNSMYDYSNGLSSPYTSDSKNRTRLLAGKVDLSHPLGGGKLYLGTEITNTNIHSEFINQEHIIPDNVTHMDESNLGVYAEYSRKVGTVSLFGGIRYEYTWADYKETAGVGEKVRRDYHEIIPSLSVRVPWKNVTLRASYSRMYNKPLYAWLTNRITYVNPNLYEAGNMYLKPAYFNFYSLSCKWKWIMLSLHYSYVTGKIMNDAIPYQGNPDIILEYKENSPRPLRQYGAVVDLTPGAIANFYYPSFTAMLYPQYYRIDFCGSPMRFTNPMGRISFNNLFKISESFSTTLNFYWSSAGDVEAGNLNGNWRLDLGISKSFGKHWDVQVNVDDIFNTSRLLKAISYTSQSITSGEWISNRRAVRLTVSYQFNVHKSRYKEGTAGEAEMERL